MEITMLLLSSNRQNSNCFREEKETQSPCSNSSSEIAIKYVIFVTDIRWHFLHYHLEKKFFFFFCKKKNVSLLNGANFDLHSDK